MIQKNEVMKVQCLEGIPNTGIMKPYKKGSNIEFDSVLIKKGRYIYNDTSHPLRGNDEFYYQRNYCLESDGKIVYWLDTFGNKSNNIGLHIGFTWKQHQKFLLMQNMHWLQKEDNIRFIVNILFLIIGVYIAFKQI